MDITIAPWKLNGNIQAIPSKSLLHRYLICAAFADKPTTICRGKSCEDVAATIDCLSALGAMIQINDGNYLVTPIQNVPKRVVLNCRESGTTLRLLLPIVGVLGIDATFLLSGRLGSRPLAPLWEEMERMGCTLSQPDENTIICHGQLRPGKYFIDGSVSSQFVSGLLLALSIVDGSCSLHVSGKLESQPYVEMTRSVLNHFGIYTEGDAIEGPYPLRSPGEISVEGDWSNAAFFLAANALGSNVNIAGIDMQSMQGDRIITKHLKLLRSNCTVDVADTPDLFPVLAVTAAACKGASFTGIHRLRYKESDRVDSVSRMLEHLGVSAKVTEDTMIVPAGKFHGGIIDSFGDHRIAMAAAIAATVAEGPVTILKAQCVNKSYPSFWEDYRKLGGVYAQYIR